MRCVLASSSHWILKMPRPPWVLQFVWCCLGRKVCWNQKQWVNAYLKLDDNDPAFQCFKELGEGSIQSELIDDELPINVKALEHFVCSVYSLTGLVQQPCPHSDGNYFDQRI